MVRLGAVLLCALATWNPVCPSVGRPRPVHADDEATEVPVVVRETPDTVRLRIHLPPGSDPGSVEIVLADRALTVRARDAAGQEIRSGLITLVDPAVETGATADYEGDGWLTMTLRKKGSGPGD